MNRSRFPSALAWAVGVPLLLTAVSWVATVRYLQTTRQSVLVLGDSNIANYRIVPGERFEDRLGEDLGPSWLVRNWGDIGADPADQYLSLCKAELVRFEPSLVVLVLSPHAFIPDTTNPGHRFRDNGDGLRFLPWNGEGWRFFQTLTKSEKDRAIVGSTERLFGFYDAYLGYRWHDDWDEFRKTQAAVDPRARDAAVEAYSQKITTWLDQNVRVDDYEAFSSLPNARDFVFFADALKARGTPLVVAILPAGNPAVLGRRFSDQTRRTLEASYDYTLRILREHRVPFVDYNAPIHRPRFGAAEYGDHYHLKSASAYRYMADGVAAWITGHGARRGS